MALFPGEDVVPVTAADGRTLMVPRSLAGMVPQQIAQLPQDPGIAPGAAPMPEMAPTIPQDYGVLQDESAAPQSVIEQLQAQGAPTDMVQNGEDYVVDPKTLSKPMQKALSPAGMKNAEVYAGKAQKAQAKVDAAYAKAQAAYEKSPAGKQEAVQARTDDATAAQAAAVNTLATVEGVEQDLVARATADSNIALNQLKDAENKEALDWQSRVEKKTNEMVGIRKKMAGTKINREADHPILAAIFAGLAGLGSAMKGEKVDTYEILTRAIDRKVAEQEADLERMGKIYGMTKDEVDMLKEQSKDKLAFHNAMFAGEVDKAKRTIEEFTARSASDKTRALAKQQIAALDQIAAQRQNASVQWGLEFDQKDQHQKMQHKASMAAVGAQYYGINMNDKLQRDKMKQDLIIAAAQDKARGDEAAYKMRIEADKNLTERGMKGVDNDYLLTAEGRAKIDAAAKLEAQAAALEGSNPAAAEATRQKAAMIRSDARTFNAVMARDPTQAGVMSKKYAAAQGMIDVIDNIKIMSDQVGRGVIGKSEGQQKLDAMYRLLAVKGKEAWQLGAWDKGSATLSKDIYGQNPAEWDQKTMRGWVSDVLGDDPKGFKGRMDVVASDLENGVTLEIAKNSNWNGKGKLFTRQEPGAANTPTDMAAGKLMSTPSGNELTKDAEAAQDSTGTAIADTLLPVRHLTGRSANSKEGAAEAAQSLRYPGLQKEQEPAFEVLARQYNSKDPAVKQRASDELAAQVVTNAEKYPDRVLPVMRNLRDHAPDAYIKARAAMPKGGPADEQLTFEETTLAGVGMVPTPQLAARVATSVGRDGYPKDQVGMRDIARRAGEGDELAKQAMVDIVSRSGQAKAAR